MPRKHPPPDRPKLNRADILHAALKLVDEHGLEALSMRKLAAELKVEAMSLYNHVKDKKDLVSGVAGLVLSQIEHPTQKLPWRDTLEYFAVNLYGAFLKHPVLASVLEETEQTSPQFLRGMNTVLTALDETGLSPREQVSAFRGLVAMCLGFVLAHTQGLKSSKEEAEQRWEEWQEEPWQASQLPQLAKMAPHFTEVHADEDFRFMLNAYLTALEDHASQRH